jgi:hypothetical protein
MDELRLRRAPRMRKMLMSAVLESVAETTLETRMPRAVQAETSIWS